MPPLVVPGHLRSVPDLPPAMPGLDPRIHDALCDLHAYVLVLDAEWRQLTDHLRVLERIGAAAEHRFELVGRQRELGQELDALRAMIATLRVQADPEGLHL